VSLGVTKSIIVDGAKDLRRAWKDVRQHWDDRMAERFETEFLEPIAPRISEAVKAMDHLQTVCQKAEADCADTGA
jgi:hypothetical protein